MGRVPTLSFVLWFRTVSWCTGFPKLSLQFLINVDLLLAFVPKAEKELTAEPETQVSSFPALHSKLKAMCSTRSQCLSAATRSRGWWGQTSVQIPTQLACHFLSAFC